VSEATGISLVGRASAAHDALFRIHVWLIFDELLLVALLLRRQNGYARPSLIDRAPASVLPNGDPCDRD
jgi:hypothetical protein